MNISGLQSSAQPGSSGRPKLISIIIYYIYLLILNLINIYNILIIFIIFFIFHLTPCILIMLRYKPQPFVLSVALEQGLLAGAKEAYAYAVTALHAMRSPGGYVSIAECPRMRVGAHFPNKSHMSYGLSAPLFTFWIPGPIL